MRSFGTNETESVRARIGVLVYDHAMSTDVNVAFDAVLLIVSHGLNIYSQLRFSYNRGATL